MRLFPHLHQMPSRICSIGHAKGMPSLLGNQQLRRMLTILQMRQMQTFILPQWLLLPAMHFHPRCLLHAIHTQLRPMPDWFHMRRLQHGVLLRSQRHHQFQLFELWAIGGQLQPMRHQYYLYGMQYWFFPRQHDLFLLCGFHSQLPDLLLLIDMLLLQQRPNRQQRHLRPLPRSQQPLRFVLCAQQLVSGVRHGRGLLLPMQQFVKLCRVLIWILLGRWGLRVVWVDDAELFALRRQAELSGLLGWCFSQWD